MRRLALLLALAMSVSELAAAHDIYGNLKQRNGMSCCSNTDCRPLSLWRNALGGIEMMVDGSWLWIAEDKVQRIEIAGDRTAAQAHWCGYITFTGVRTTFCAIVPPNSY